MTPAPVRAAVIGAGFVGGIHARALAEDPRVDLVGLCARTSRRLDPLAARHAVTPYRDVGELLDAQHPDLVCVCTGNDEHVEPSLAAIEAGAHVFVEKPMAFRLEEARRMVEAADVKAVRLGVNLNHRFSEPYRRALAFARSPGLGEPAFLAMRFAGDLYPDLNDPYCMLIETQGHSFDLLRLFGGEIAELRAFLSDPRGIGVYTSAAIAMRFLSGAVGSLLGSWDASYEQPAAITFEMSGSTGRVVVENVIDAVRTARHDRPEVEEWRPGLFRTEQRDFWRTIDAHVRAFVGAIVDGTEPPVSGRDGLRALELTYAAIASFEEERSVQV